LKITSVILAKPINTMYTTINLKKETVENLKKIGKFGESFDALIHRLVEETVKNE